MKLVGAGSSGSLLAHRLSKDFKVLVLEAGGSPNPLMSIPGLGPMLVRNPDVDWMYQTVPQKKSCYSLNEQVWNYHLIALETLIKWYFAYGK